MMRAAHLASGTPVALLEKGTVRLARGFISMTDTWPSLTAYCTLSRPLTPQPRASWRVISRTRSRMASESEKGGVQQAESPEWMPHSSMCSRTAPT